LGRLGGFVSALVIASVAVGCGSSASGPPTKAEFVERGDAICEKGKQEKDAAAIAYEEKNHLDTPQKVSKAVGEGLVTDVVLPPLRAMVEELDDLDPPSGDEDHVAAMIGSFEKELEEIERDPGDALLGFPFAQAEKLAAAYGLKRCAEL
jgi:hypothetical protein